MGYQVIAFDLDGTLLNSQGKILESSKEAIQAARQQGKKVLLVTGRHHIATIPYYDELGLDTPMICCNGTYIYEPLQNLISIENPLSKEQAEFVLRLAQQYPIHLLMYSRDAMNYQTLNPHMQKFVQWANSCPEAVRPNVQQIEDFQQLIDQGESIWKFVISHEDHRLMEDVVAQFPEQEFSCEWSWVDRVDIAKQGNSKGGRLLELLKIWQVEPQEVIAFGDNFNDLSMLTSVGLGVAMGNAEDEIKQQADLVTLSNNEDGIAQVLSQYL